MSVTQLGSASERSAHFDARIAEWRQEIQRAQRKTRRRSLPAWFALGLGILALGVGVLYLDEYRWLSIAAAAGLVAIAVLLFRAAKRFRLDLVERCAAEMLRACDEEEFSRADVVEALYDHGSAQVHRELLEEIDHDAFALLDLRKRANEGVRELSSHAILPMQISAEGGSGAVTVSMQGEEDIERFSLMAVDALAHKGYAEGIAALSMVQMLYVQIAPPGGELWVKTNVSHPALQDAATSAHKIMSTFDLMPDIKATREAVAQRDTQSFIELMLAAQQQEIALDALSSATAISARQLKVRDQRFAGACIDYLAEQERNVWTRYKSYELLTQIPDERVTPYILKAFSAYSFFPQGIEAVGRLEGMTSQLIDAVEQGTGSLRFNAAMALGFMQTEAAKPILSAVEPTLADATEQISVWYALVRLGHPGCLASIVAMLDHMNPDVRHAAAIALEHLEAPLDERTYLKALADANMLVRLRMIRKLASQALGTSAIVEALVVALNDPHEDVRAAAVTALSKLTPELVAERMMALTGSGVVHARLSAYDVLARIAHREAVPLMISTLSNTRDKAMRRALISALGEMGIAEAIDQIAPYLENEDLSGAAFWALLRISFQDKEAVLPVFSNPNQFVVKRLFLLSVHGDQKAREELKRMLKPQTDFMTLLQALEYVQALKDPIYEEPLRKLLSYRKSNHFPGDRYVPYLALKALTQLQLAKA